MRYDCRLLLNNVQKAYNKHKKSKKNEFDNRFPEVVYVQYTYHAYFHSNKIPFNMFSKFLLAHLKIQSLLRPYVSIQAAYFLADQLFNQK